MPDSSYRQFGEQVALITGAAGALGSAIAESFIDAGATVCGVDVVDPTSDDSLLNHTGIEGFTADLTEESEVTETINSIVERHDRLDIVANIAGTWRGGTPMHETAEDTFDQLFDINLKTMFLTSKHAIPHLRETGGSIVSVSARSSLEGGEGDGPYRASKAGIRLLTETIAEENKGQLRANAIMPSVIDTPMNREMMPDADFDRWVDPTDIASVVQFLCSDAAAVTSGAAVPVYGDA